MLEKCGGDNGECESKLTKLGTTSDYSHGLHTVLLNRLLLVGQGSIPILKCGDPVLTADNLATHSCR